MVAKTIAVALLACLPAALLTACKKEQPMQQAGRLPAVTTVHAKATPTPTPVPTPVPPVAMPPAVEAEDANLLAYARLREPAKSLERAAAWASRVDPSMTSDTLRQQLQIMGVDPAQLRPGANLAVFLYKSSDPAVSRPGWAALVPTTAESPLGQSAAKVFNAQAQGKVGNDVLLASNQATLQAAQAAGAKLKAISEASMQTDVQIYLNVAGLMTQYGPMLRNGVTMLQGMAAGAAAQSKDPKAMVQAQQMQRILGAESTAFFDALDQIQSLTINLDLAPQAFELALVARAKPGTAVSAAFNKPPISAPDLARFVTGDHTMEMQISVSDMKGLSDLYLKYGLMVLPADKPEPIQQLKDMLSKMVAVGPMDYAFALDFQPGQPMVYEGLARVAKPEQMIQIMRENVVAAKLNLMGELSGGVKYEVVAKEKARTVQGQPVDQYVMKINFPPNLPSQQAEMIKKMWGEGPITVEAMPLGSLVLFSMGRPIDELARRVASGATGATMPAQKAFEPGGCFYMDMNMIKYLQWIMSIMAPQAAPMPAIGASVPPLSLAGYHQNGAGYYRMKFPRELVVALKSIGGSLAEMNVPAGQTPGMPGTPGAPSSPSPIH
jgi:hypothetical protein